MRILLRMVPLFLVEVVARSGGWMVGIAKPSYAYTAERRIRGFYWAMRLGGRRLKIGRNVQFESDRITLGANVAIYDGTQVATGPTGFVKIGNNSHVSRLSIISGAGGVTIGMGVAISAHVAIYSTTTDLQTSLQLGADAQLAPVMIGDNAYIGVGAKIIPGISIGEGAVVGAGAVVVRDVPRGHIAKGVPARTQCFTKRAIEG